MKPLVMQVVLNGKTVETTASVLADLVSEQAQAGAKVATALNGAFVPAVARANTALKPGDRVEIVSARQGG
jgi:sulfur carrier protein